MGGIISTVRDVKVILRDLKITLKFTAKIVLKVHGIVDEMEQTMQELKETVNGLSSRLPKSPSNESLLDEATTNYVNEVVHTIESKAESMRASLSNAVAVFTSDDLVKNTSNAWGNLVGHQNLVEVMSKWASVPEGIGEMVKQDCEKLSEFVNNGSGDRSAIKNASNALQDVEMKLSEKLDHVMDISTQNSSEEICQLISNNAIPTTVHLLIKTPSINDCLTPEIVIEDILTHRIDTERLLKQFGCLDAFKAKYSTEWIAKILNQTRQIKHKTNHEKNTSSKTTENDMKTIGEFQTEMIFLMFEGLIQGFLKNMESCGTDGGTMFLGCD